MIIHWFRRDLRLTDNTALNAASRDSGGHVVPVYIQSDWKGSHRWTGAPRQEFLCGSLQALASGLEKAGSRLIVRKGSAIEELERLIAETGAEAVYFNRDPDPFGREAEKRLAALAKRLGLRTEGFTDVTALPPDAVLTGSGTPYRVFTAYSKAWLRVPTPTPDSAKLKLHAPLSALKSHSLPDLSDWELSSTAKIVKPGEPAARRRMEAFFASPVYRYQSMRDIPSAEATSRLSADLRYGTLSIREVIHRCRVAAGEASTAKERNSAQIFLNELIWREFYMAVLWHWPEVLEEEFQSQFRGLPWLYPQQKPTALPLRHSAVQPEEAFQRWCGGTTGFPIVDAGMRQLAATGFMHNRVRMIVAMFLTKDLHLDWRLGEQYFMQMLTDGEIASNNGGWQWSAGTGADAAPYFRIQNPWTQTAKFDPEGDYIKIWIPELRDLPGAIFSKPPRPGMRFARGYPLPIVDHAQERAITLEVFKAHGA